VPLPDPGVPDVTVSQLALLETAVQLHPAPAVTKTLPVPPPAATVALVEPSEGEQLDAAAWLTVKTFPAISNVPLRVDVKALAAMLNATEPLPVPLAPLVTVIHEAPLTAFQPHVAVTPTEPVVAAAPTLDELDASVDIHVVVSSNVLLRALSADPPAPTAETVLS
jgi:hypothetical protein